MKIHVLWSGLIPEDIATQEARYRIPKSLALVFQMSPPLEDVSIILYLALTRVQCSVAASGITSDISLVRQLEGDSLAGSPWGVIVSNVV